MKGKPNTTQVKCMGCGRWTKVSDKHPEPWHRNKQCERKAKQELQ